MMISMILVKCFLQFRLNNDNECMHIVFNVANVLHRNLHDCNMHVMSINF